jgi:hypothetical protein
MRHGRIICGSCRQEIKYFYPREAERRMRFVIVISLTIACSVALGAIAWWAFA